MKTHLNILNTVAEYQEYSASTSYSKPNVTYVRENKVLYYDYGNNRPEADFSKYKGEFAEIAEGGNTWFKSAIISVNYIPSGVTSLKDTFNECRSLVNVSEIPSGVTNMEGTFSYCESLINAPAIPSGVTNMKSTFLGCSSLVNAPAIPSGVTDMQFTFCECY